MRTSGRSRRCSRRPAASTPSGTWATWWATGPSPTRSSRDCPRSARPGSAATTTPPRSAAREIELFNVDARRAMEWTREIDHGPTTREWLATQPLRRTEGRLHAGPRQSPRSDLGVHHVGAGRAANLALLETPYGLFGHTHLPDRVPRRRRAIETTARGRIGRASRRPAGAAQPGQRRPAPRRRPALVVHGDRHGAGPRFAGAASGTTSHGRRRRCARGACQTGWSNGSPTACS